MATTTQLFSAIYFTVYSLVIRVSYATYVGSPNSTTMRLTSPLARLTAERRHYKDLHAGPHCIRAVHDQYSNRALWVTGGGYIRLIYSARPKQGQFSDDRVEFRQSPSGRPFRVSYFFNPALIFPLGKKPFKISPTFLSKSKAQPRTQGVKVAWLTAQARHYHKFLLADGHKITLDRYTGKGGIRTLKKWTPNSLTFYTIASRKQFLKHSDGKFSDMRLKGMWGWIDIYHPEQCDIWDMYTRHEPKPEVKQPFVFTLDEDF